MKNLKEILSLEDVSKGDMVLCVRGNKHKTYGKVLNLDGGDVTYGGHEYMSEARELGATVCGAGHWSPINSELPTKHGCHSKLYFVKEGTPKRNIPLQSPRKGSPAFDLMF